jgi:hypothetical protein
VDIIRTIGASRLRDATSRSATAALSVPETEGGMQQLGTFVVPDESTFYSISRDLYKYEETKPVRALPQSTSFPSAYAQNLLARSRHAAICK